MIIKSKSVVQINSYPKKVKTVLPFISWFITDPNTMLFSFSTEKESFLIDLIPYKDKLSNIFFQVKNLPLLKYYIFLDEDIDGNLHLKTKDLNGKEHLIPIEKQISTQNEDKKKTTQIILNSIEKSQKEAPRKKLKEFNLSTELEDAILYILLDYCIIDTNIWMPTNPDYRKYNHESIHLLMNIFKYFEKTLVAHGHTYEELKRIKENKLKKYSPAESFAAEEGFNLLSNGNENGSINIPELDAEHNIKAYADKAIYNYASKIYQEKNSVSIISNDRDCRIRVRSVLQDYKSDIAFRFINSTELKKYTDVIFDTDWYKNLKK